MRWNALDVGIVLTTARAGMIYLDPSFCSMKMCATLVV